MIVQEKFEVLLPDATSDKEHILMTLRSEGSSMWVKMDVKDRDGNLICKGNFSEQALIEFGVVLKAKKDAR